MPFLLDTNILVRLANASDPMNPIADRAILELHRRGEVIHVTAQNLVEFRSVATRPKAANGLGLSIQEAESKSAQFEGVFPLLAESPDIFPSWKAIVSSAGVISKQVHDARLIPVCQVNKITHVLTFNTSQFSTIAAHVAGLVVVDPSSI